MTPPKDREALRELIADVIFAPTRLSRKDSDTLAEIIIEMVERAGLVIVPKEPSHEQLEAARDWSIRVNGRGVGNDQATACYSAMLAASPFGGETK